MLNKTILLLTILATFILFSIPVFAEEEYYYGYKIYPTWPLSDVYVPKVACTNDYSHCAMLVYEHSTLFSRGVKLVYSTDQFKTDKRVYQVNYCSFDVPQNRNNFSLSYDLTYRESDGKYYIVAPKTGSCNQTSTLKTFDIVNGIQTVNDISSTCGLYFHYIRPLGITGKDTSQPILNTVCGSCSAGGGIICNGQLYFQRYWLYNLSLIENTRLWQDTGTNCNVAGGNFDAGWGFVADTGTTRKYYIISHLYCPTSITIPNQYNITMPTTFTGINDYSNNYLYYTRNGTVGVTDGVWKTYSTDLATFSTSELYYPFGSGEFITSSSTDILERDQIFSYDRRGGINGTGIYVYDRSLFPIFFSSYYIEPSTRERNPVSQVATVECPNLNYSSSGTGSNIDLSTLCPTNTTIKTDNNLYIPIHSESTHYIDPNYCSSFSVISIYYPKTYQIPIRVIDAITNSPISGATVKIGDTTYATDANGTVIVTIIDPIINSGFSTSVIGCSLALSPYGNPKMFRVTINKTDYEIKELLDDTFVTEQGGYITFVPEKTYQLEPSGARVNVRIKTFNGVEFFPTSGEVTINGANKTYWYFYYENIEEPQRLSQNVANRFPALFILINDTYPIAINATFEYVGKTYTSFVYNGTTYNNLNVTEGNTYDISFIVDESLDNLSCTDITDCPENYCLGDDFYSATSCTNNRCKWSNEDCVLCDENVGCFDVATTDECDIDFDCSNICATNYSSYTGFCGSDGYCKQKKIICKTLQGCNETTGLCQETQICYESGGWTERFLILTGELDFEVIDPSTWFVPAEYTTHLDYKFRCSLETVGQEICINGEDVLTTDQEIGINTWPENWPYDKITRGGLDYYHFHDIIAECGFGCNVTYTFCKYGCNYLTNNCNSQPTSTEGQIGNIMLSLKQWFYTIFPDAFSQSLFSAVIIIIVSGLITFGASKYSGTPQWQIGATSSIILALVLSFVGLLPMYIGIIFAIIAGIILVRNIGLWPSTG